MSVAGDRSRADQSVRERYLLQTLCRDTNTRPEWQLAIRPIASSNCSLNSGMRASTSRNENVPFIGGTGSCRLAVFHPLKRLRGVPRCLFDVASSRNYFAERSIRYFDLDVFDSRARWQHCLQAVTML